MWVREKGKRKRAEKIGEQNESGAEEKARGERGKN